MSEKVMPLCQAIRLGSMMKPQTNGSFLRGGGTCALGAALDAMCLLDVVMVLEANVIPKEWNIHMYVKSCPDPAVCICITRTLGETITHLNDGHKWTRERIADQVEIWEKETGHDGTTTIDHGTVHVKSEPRRDVLDLAGVPR